MSLQEKPPQVEVTPSRYIPLHLVPPLDYYFGNRYQGSYYNRLFIDEVRIEEICRAANLPPFVISHEDWIPPIPKEPDIVGHANGQAVYGFRGLFKKGLAPQETTQVYSTIEQLPDQLLDDSEEYEKEISLGWLVRINSRKILADYNGKNPNSTKRERELFFEQAFDSLLKFNLVKVTLAEAFALRGSIMDKIADIGMSSIPFWGGISASNISALIDFEINLVKSQNFWMGVGLVLNFPSALKSMRNVRGWTNNLMMQVNNWRAENYQERYEVESKKGDYMRQRFVSNFIPGGLLMHSVIAATSAAYLNTPHSLVQLPPEQ